MLPLFSRKTVLLLLTCVLVLATGAVGSAAAAPDSGSAATAAVSGTPALSADGDNATQWASENDSATASATSSSVIDVSYDVDRTPGDVGRVRVNYTAVLPESTVALYVYLGQSLDAPYTVVSTDGFTYDQGVANASSPRDQVTTATLSYVVETNTSSTLSGGYNSVETTDWALIGSAQLDLSHRWSYDTSYPAPELRETYGVDGEGYAGDGRAFLGPVDVYSRQAGGQSFTLVVPTAASSVVAPDAALDGLANASADLAVGDVDPDVTGFVAPDPIRRGGRAGGSSFWVHEESTLAADSTWLHEYVHTRQAWVDSDYSLRVASDVEWFTEASADYYGARLAWRAGSTDAVSFHDFVATDQYASEVLQDADSQSTEYKNYYKGRRVLAALDVRIREHTGGNHTLLDVFEHVNSLSSNDQFGYADVRGEVVTLTNATTGDWLDTYVQTDAAPDIPPLEEMRAIYGEADASGSPLFQVGYVSPSEANRTRGQTLDVRAGVTNEGTAAGTATVEFRVAGAVVDTTNVTLDNGSGTVVQSTLPTDHLEPGTYTYGVYAPNDSRTGTLRVLAPPPVAISGLTPTDATVAQGEPLNGTVVVSNDGSVTTTRAVELRFNGSVVDTVNVTLSAGNQTTLPFTLVTDDVPPGNYTYGVFSQSDNQTGTVRITPPEIDASRALSTTTPSPGENVTVTLAATARGETLSVEESFAPAFANASVENVTVDGAAATPAQVTANGSVVGVSLAGLTSGQRVTIRYTVTVPDNATDGAVYAVDGTVTTGKTAALPTDSLTVEASPFEGVTAEYDQDNDGRITISELGSAAADYVRDRITISELGTVAAAYVRS